MRGTPSDRGAETDKGRQEADGLRNSSVVPFRDVLAEYARTAARAVEREGYPVRLRSTVQDYFTQLGAPQ